VSDLAGRASCNGGAWGLRLTRKVVNLRNSDYDVYIGRAGKGQDGYFGNPFSVAEYGYVVCIAKFREYFYERVQTDIEFKRRVDALSGKTLGCFCFPKPCHGDVVAEYVNGQQPVEIKQGKLF
jgi:hypothetical protein